jgi:GNAT superfamily N-acetyltransferase
MSEAQLDLFNTNEMPVSRMRANPRRAPQSFVIREVTPLDLTSLMILSEAFFADSGWKEFTSFNHDGMLQHFSHLVGQPFHETGQCIYMCDTLPVPDGNGGETPQVSVGFIKFGVQVCSTTEPVGVLDAVYVLPEYRLSTAGRILFAAAENKLRSLGACVFFASPGAKMGGVDKSMANMLSRMGFDVPILNGCKVLR